MKRNKVINTLIDGFSIIMVLALATILGLVWRERHYSKKFEATPTGITAWQVKKEWAEPDRYFNDPNGRIIMTYDNSIIGSYLFIMDKDSVVNQKYLDD